MTVNNERSSRNSNHRSSSARAYTQSTSGIEIRCQTPYTRPRVFRGCFQAEAARSSRIEADNEPTKRITGLLSSFHSESPDSPIRVYHVHVRSCDACRCDRSRDRTNRKHAFHRQPGPFRWLRRMTNGLCGRFEDRNCCWFSLAAGV